MKTQRSSGFIPAVVYGAKKDPRSLWVNRKELEKAMTRVHGANVLFKLMISDPSTSLRTGKSNVADAKAETVLLKSLQRDVCSDLPIHADFLRVDIHQKVEISVAVHVKGEAKGVKDQGGILEHLLREIKVRCLPTEIPAAIEVDVSKLEIGQGVTAGDLKLPEGVERLTVAAHVVINIVAPARVEEAAAPAAAAGGEPEVIAKGKKEEEAQGAAAGAQAKPAAAGAQAKTAAAPAAAKTEAPKK
ncbi:MAG: 50S ribosomal protein L25 [Elusimicrobia bacterium]|nr:50S ribosomal protein L25 [Elusimicrobiota bacterium]